MRGRHTAARERGKPVTLYLMPEEIASLKATAQARGLPMSRLVGQWARRLKPNWRTRDGSSG